jgi:gluconolactonase
MPPTSGAVIKVADDIDRPNGVQLSPDEKVLYVNNSGGQYLLAFDVQVDGSLRNRHDFARYKGFAMTPQGIHESRADGLAVDADGRVYGCTPAGVEVFSPQGQALGVIPFPRIPQNLAFGGADKKTLYVVGNGSAYKVAMLAQGYTGRAK